MSIRLRLTLLYSAILALTLIAFSAVLYAAQAQYTLAAQKRDLQMAAQRIATGIAFRFASPAPADVRAGHPRPEVEPQALREWRVRDIVNVRSMDGETADILASEDIELPLSEEGLRAVQKGADRVETAVVDDERMLIYAAPILVSDQVIGIVLVARPLTHRDRALEALGGALLVGILLTLCAAFGGGWMLSGITLRPIHRITHTAQAIGAERDFARRVQHAGPDDEVGRLATTFNAMLAELQDAYQHVEQSLAMQRDFVADVSHELRTPLTTIRGNLELLRRQPLIPAEEREDVLSDVVDETDRLIRLVGDLLSLARADAGQLLQRERVPLRPLIEETCRQAQLLDPRRAIQCDLQFDAEAIADRAALKQVLLILLDNAFKYTQDTVFVSLEPAPASSPGSTLPSLAVRVRDSGPGIEPDKLGHLFERYYRGKEARAGPGLGLGLPIAKALVEAQGGTISVHSQPKQGSTFTVLLPQAPPESP